MLCTVMGFTLCVARAGEPQLLYVNFPSAALSTGSEFMIVFLRGMIEFHGEAVHDQYADSANDGPWGTALTSEFIPATDAHFRTLGAGGRFLFEHSSGGWSALWLQVN